MAHAVDILLFLMALFILQTNGTERSDLDIGLSMYCIKTTSPHIGIGDGMETFVHLYIEYRVRGQVIDSFMPF